MPACSRRPDALHEIRAAATDTHLDARGQRAGAPTGPYPAAPLPALVYKSPPAQCAYDWTGIYFGADGGFGWTMPKGTLLDGTGSPLAPYSYRVDGPVAGLFVGGNYQMNKIALGVEGDWQWSNLTGNSQMHEPLFTVGTFPGGPFTISTAIKDYAAVRGRLGLALDRFLVFGTGGWVWGNPLTSHALTDAPPFVNNGGNSMGWTAGVGSTTHLQIAYLVASNMATQTSPLRAS